LHWLLLLFYLSRRLRRSLAALSSQVSRHPMALMRRLGAAPFIDWLWKVLCLITSTPEMINLLLLFLNLVNVFAINLKSWESPSFHSLRWLKGFGRDLRGTQAASRKKKGNVCFLPKHAWCDTNNKRKRDCWSFQFLAFLSPFVFLFLPWPFFSFLVFLIRYLAFLLLSFCFFGCFWPCSFFSVLWAFLWNFFDFFEKFWAF